MLLLLIWGVVIVAALVLYLNDVYSRFSRHGVNNPPAVPLAGNMLRVILRRETFMDCFERLYKCFPGDRFIGIFQFTNPVIIIKDLDLIKKIAIKDFEHFLDHRAFVDEESDSLFGRNLFSLRGQEWKDMRSTLSPAFTSSKIRVMVPFMVDVGEEMIKWLKKKLQDSGTNHVDLEVKDLASRYANDVIASCAFGLKVNSHVEEDNEFYRNGKIATNFGSLVLIKFFAIMAAPALSKLLKLSLFGEETNTYFRKLVLSTMADREERHIHRPDMIQLLMEAKKGKVTHEDKTVEDATAGFATVQESNVGKKTVTRVWSDDDLVAQATLFFFAGFETVATTMWFVLYELALNPETQEKLSQEIRENEVRNNGKFDYNSIQRMQYLDMIVSEVLRLWAAAPTTDRLCVKDYNLGRPNDKATEDYIVRKGELINIPIWGIHRNPEYFPDPYKFDPERFSEDNKHNIKPFTYIPFGLGPRNCIGSRFALCMVKVMIYQLIQHMKVSPCKKTTIPLELRADSFNFRVKGGHWLRFEVRD